MRLECESCDGLGFWCNYCGATGPCDCPTEGGYSGTVFCRECNGEGGIDAPEHVLLAVPDGPEPEPTEHEIAAELANEVQSLRGDVAREQRYIVEQQHVSLCAAGELERVQQALNEMRAILDASPDLMPLMLRASAPFLKVRAGIVAARAALTSGMCAHTKAQLSKSNRPGRVIPHPATTKAAEAR